MTDYGPRETNERPWDWGRITEHARIVKELKEHFGAVPLPQRPPTGFTPREEKTP